MQSSLVWNRGHTTPPRRARRQVSLIAAITIDASRQATRTAIVPIQIRGMDGG
jgi:hypothetical protein